MEGTAEGGLVPSNTGVNRYDQSWMFPRKWMLASLDQSELEQLNIFKSGHDHDVIRIKGWVKNFETLNKLYSK